MNLYETDVERRKLLSELESDVDYTFRDVDILERALTHKSYIYENHSKHLLDNEAMEFLGDAVLGFLSSAELFVRHPSMREGTLSKIKAFLVSSSSLYKRALGLGLGRYLRLGYGEEKSGGRHKRAILVDAFEALVAAVYLDGGIEAAEVFVRREFFGVAPMFDMEEATYTDYKSTLQERLHLLRQPEPRYRTIGEVGPDHRKTFIVEVNAQRVVLARAEGRTKKEAQQEVARLALETLKNWPAPVEPIEVPGKDRLRRSLSGNGNPPGAAGRKSAAPRPSPVGYGRAPSPLDSPLWVPAAIERRRSLRRQVMMHRAFSHGRR